MHRTRSLPVQLSALTETNLNTKKPLRKCYFRAHPTEPTRLHKWITSAIPRYTSCTRNGRWNNNAQKPDLGSFAADSPSRTAEKTRHCAPDHLSPCRRSLLSQLRNTYSLVGCERCQPHCPGPRMLRRNSALPQPRSYRFPANQTLPKVWRWIILR